MTEKAKTLIFFIVVLSALAGVLVWSHSLSDENGFIDYSDVPLEVLQECESKITTLTERLDNQQAALSRLEKTYDPNDPAYKFIPEAPEDWRDKFGTNERTRLLHSISELRVVVAAQGRKLMELADPNVSVGDVTMPDESNKVVE